MALDADSFHKPDASSVRIRFTQNRAYEGTDYGPGYPQQVADVAGWWARHFVRQGAAVYVAPEVEPAPAVPEAKPPAQKPEVKVEPAPEVDATPAARKLAAEHGLDLATIQGTGAGGRIIATDVQALIG